MPKKSDKIRAGFEYTSHKKEFEGVLNKVVDGAVKRSVRIMERNVKDAATYFFTQRTGNLRRSVKSNEDMGVGRAQIEINPVSEGADVNYGYWIEYGNKFMPPRPFIRAGVERSEKAIQALFSKALQSLKIQNNVADAPSDRMKE